MRTLETWRYKSRIHQQLQIYLIVSMEQLIFVSCSKFSAPVMTLDSRDTQWGCLQSFPKKMALTNIFAHFMQRVVYTSNVLYVRAFICQIKAGLLRKVMTSDCQFFSSTRGNNQGNLRTATKIARVLYTRHQGLEYSKFVRKPLFPSKVGREGKTKEKKISKNNPNNKEEKCQKARRQCSG